jgi:hypothetical protein
MFIYIVIENGDPYTDAYLRYEDAVAAVKDKYREEIEEELKWLDENPGEHGCNDVDVPEKQDGPTWLYIEKGIHIFIYKYKI